MTSYVRLYTPLYAPAIRLYGLYSTRYTAVHTQSHRSTALLTTPEHISTNTLKLSADSATKQGGQRLSLRTPLLVRLCFHKHLPTTTKHDTMCRVYPRATHMCILITPSVQCRYTSAESKHSSLPHLLHPSLPRRKEKQYPGDDCSLQSSCAVQTNIGTLFCPRAPFLRASRCAAPSSSHQHRNFASAQQ